MTQYMLSYKTHVCPTPFELSEADVWSQQMKPYQVMTLSAMGLAETPAGGSVCIRLKSRISLLRAAVDIVIVPLALQQHFRTVFLPTPPTTPVLGTADS